jgi:hypothetical protein
MEKYVAKTAKIVPVATPDASGFAWKWRASDGVTESTSIFVYYYECVEDARSTGYAVELAGSVRKGVDGSNHPGLA